MHCISQKGMIKLIEAKGPSLSSMYLSLVRSCEGLSPFGAIEIQPIEAHWSMYQYILASVPSSPPMVQLLASSMHICTELLTNLGSDLMCTMNGAPGGHFGTVPEYTKAQNCGPFATE